MTDLARLTPKVLSVADPHPDPLLGARELVRTSETTRALFMEAKQNHDASWLAEHLAPILIREFPLREGMSSVARYLADEYFQIGDGVLLISATTGQVIAKLRDEDIYVPSPVLRGEFGLDGNPTGESHLVHRPPRLRPEIEGAVTEHHFNEAKEAIVTASLANRLPTTPLLQETGDRRLQSLTRSGRKQIGVELKEELPRILPDRCTGTAKLFLDHFEVRSEPPEDRTGLEELPLQQECTRTRILIADAKTRNLKFDPKSFVMAAVASSWVRGLAEKLLATTQKRYPGALPLETLQEEDLEGFTCWAGEPNTLALLSNFHGTLLPISVGVGGLLGVRRRAGVLVIDPQSYNCSTRELFDRWEVEANFSYTLWVDWDAVKLLSLSEVPVSGLSVEVL